MMHEDYRAGVLTMVMRQIVGDKKAATFDYFPEHQKKTKKSAKQRKREFEQRMLGAAIAAKKG